ncbi:MAG: tetratricopeptide repeat protein [Myxococcota bacterium]|nr:tetratricopeptide repeat protein [Myxococcota bacterium]
MTELDKAIWKTPFRPYILLFLWSFSLWIGVIHSGYVSLDTPWLVVNNPILSSGSYNQISTIFTDISLGTRLVLGAEYLPMRDLSVLLDFALFGDRFAFHHFSNLLLYLGSVLLLLRIAIELFGKSGRIWLLVLLFAVHPIHVESVAWLASRKDVLSLFFICLAILSFLRSSRPMLWACVFGMCAYWSKNTAITLAPILVVLSVYYKKEDWKSPRWWRQWIPLAMCFGVGLFITMYVGGQVAMFAPPRSDHSLGILSITAQAWVAYAQLLFLPLSLSIFYVEPVEGWYFSSVLGLVFIVICISFPLFYKKKATALGLAWILFGLLPVSQITPIQNLIADRYLLLPSIGLIFIGADYVEKQRMPYLVFFACLLFSFLTHQRIQVWHSSETLWRDLIEKQSREPRGWTALAGYYIEQGNATEAETVLRTGLRVLPDNPQIYQSLGTLYYKTGELSRAQLMFEMALAQDNTLRKAQNNLSLILHKEGESEKALNIATELCKQHPLYETGWNTRAAIALDVKKYDEAESSLEQAHRLNPYAVSVLVNYGNLAYLRQDYPRAKMWWERSLMLDPEQSHAKAGLEHLKTLSPAP